MLQITLAEFKIEFDQFLMQFLKEKMEESAKINPTAAQNIQLISQLVANGGKRIRPFLVFLGFGMNEKIEKLEKLKILKVGAALELFHTFALIHDDLIDNSLIRRGLPTIEMEYRKIFEKVSQKNKKNEKLTETEKIMARNATILAGDFAHTLADLLMNTVENFQVRELYYQMQFELVAGQLDDCFGVGMSQFGDLTEEKILNMLRAKSGNYSIQKPLLMGWKLANSFKNSKNIEIEKNDEKTENQVLETQKLEIQEIIQNKKAFEEVLAQIGEEIGLVFQLKDDILGVFGEISIGKSSESDLRDGKKTLLIYQTWANSNYENRQFIEDNLGQENGDFDGLRKLIIESGALENIEKMCQKLSQNAIFGVKTIFKKPNNPTQNHKNEKTKNLDILKNRNLEKNSNYQINLEKYLEIKSVNQKLSQTIQENQTIQLSKKEIPSFQNPEKESQNQFYVNILLELINYLANRKK